MTTANHSPDPTDILTIIDEDGDTIACTIACTVAEFCTSNAEDPDLVAEILALVPGGSTTTGGGAFPFVTISKVL